MFVSFVLSLLDVLTLPKLSTLGSNWTPGPVADTESTTRTDVGFEADSGGGLCPRKISGVAPEMITALSAMRRIPRFKFGSLPVLLDRECTQLFVLDKYIFISWYQST
jgi:hypothetical protein